MAAHDILVRPADSGDWPSVEHILDETFGQPTETRLVNALREDGVLSLAFLGLLGQHPVGFLAASPVTLEPTRQEDRLSAIGPVAVRPGYQHRGVGVALVKAALASLREAGHTAVVVLGHADYYSRFGFSQARRHRLHCAFERPPASLMVCPLQTDALLERSGMVHFRPEFDEV